MSSTANESLIREWFRRVWNQLDGNAIDELFAPDAVAHWLDAVPVRGPAAFREFHRILSSSLRDIHLEVVREIQVDDLVAFQAEVRLVSVWTGNSSCVQRRRFRQGGAWHGLGSASALLDLEFERCAGQCVTG